MEGVAPLPMETWELSEWEWNPYLLQATKDSGSGPLPAPQLGLKGESPPHNHICQVDGCTFNMEEMDSYDVRYKVCKLHQKASSVMVAGILQRFCQQCGGFHPLDRFVGDRRSCQLSLDRHNTRRRERRAARASTRRDSSSLSPTASRRSPGKSLGRTLFGSGVTQARGSPEASRKGGKGAAGAAPYELGRAESAPGRHGLVGVQKPLVAHYRYYKLAPEVAAEANALVNELAPGEETAATGSSSTTQGGASRGWHTQSSQGTAGSQGSTHAGRDASSHQPRLSDSGRSSGEESSVVRRSSPAETWSQSSTLPEEVCWMPDFEDVRDIDASFYAAPTEWGADVVDWVPPVDGPEAKPFGVAGGSGTKDPVPPPAAPHESVLSSSGARYTPPLEGADPASLARLGAGDEQTLACAAYKLYQTTPEHLTPDLISSLRVLLRSDPLTGYIRKGCVQLLLDGLEPVPIAGEESEDDDAVARRLGACLERAAATLPGRRLVAQRGGALACWTGDGKGPSAAVAPSLRPGIAAALPAVQAVDGAALVEVQLADASYFDRDRIVVRASGVFVPFEIVGWDEDAVIASIRVDLGDARLGASPCLQLQTQAGSLLSDPVGVVASTDRALVEDICTLAAQTGSKPAFQGLLFAVGLAGADAGVEGAPLAIGAACRAALPFLARQPDLAALRALLRHLLRGAGADADPGQALARAEALRAAAGALPLAHLALGHGAAGFLALAEEAAELGCDVPLLDPELLRMLAKTSEPAEAAPVLARASEGEEALRQLASAYPDWARRAAQAAGLATSSSEAAAAAGAGPELEAAGSSGLLFGATFAGLNIQPQLSWLLGFEDGPLEQRYGHWMAQHQTPFEALALGAAATALLMASPSLFSVSTLVFGSVASLFLAALLVMRTRFDLYVAHHDKICAVCQLVQKVLWVCSLYWLPDAPQDEQLSGTTTRFGVPASVQAALTRQLVTTALILVSFGLRPRFRTQVWLAFTHTLGIAYTRPLSSAGLIRKLGMRLGLMGGLLGLIVLLGRLEIKSRVAFLREERGPEQPADGLLAKPDQRLQAEPEKAGTHSKQA